MPFLYVLCYLAVAVFLVAVVARAWKLARLPVHLRWELYPVAHEKGRARYGGSYMEEPEWWTKRRETSKLGELKVMVPEILLLEGVREENRSQWLRTFPFHGGLYLLSLCTVLLIAGGILGAIDSGGFLGLAIPIAGYAGLGLGLLGAGALLLRRIAEEDYREYSYGADYLNLGLFVAAFGVTLAAQIGSDPSFLEARAFFAGLFRFEPVPIGALQAVGYALLALLVAYVPLTHMSHFFTKYFMYHDIRWSDEPLVKGGRLEARVGGVLGTKPTWSAPHVDAADGSRTWGEIATARGGSDDDGEGGER